MRNLCAFVLSVLTSLLGLSLGGFVLLQFRMAPFDELATGSFDPSRFFLLAERGLGIIEFLVIPGVAALTGLVAGLSAKDREYTIGLAGVAPLLALLPDGYSRLCVRSRCSCGEQALQTEKRRGVRGEDLWGNCTGSIVSETLPLSPPSYAGMNAGRDARRSITQYSVLLTDPSIGPVRLNTTPSPTKCSRATDP